MSSREDFRRYMKAVDGSGAAEIHPSEGELLAHAKDSLGTSDRELVERHVAHCARCAESLSDLRDFFEPPRQGEEELSEVELASAWESVSRRLPRHRARSPWSVLRSTIALAASVVLAVGLGFWTLQLDRRNRELEGLLSARESRLGELETENQQLQETRSRYLEEIAELKHPRPNALLVDLFSREWVQRSGGGSAVVEIGVPQAIQSYVLILSGEGERRAGEHALEILDAEGKRVWRGEGMRQDPQGNYVVTLDRSFLGNGEYRLVLFVKRDGDFARVAEYALRVKNQ